MIQPVRKNIIEKHPELSEKVLYTLLVDGTNLLRICEKDERVNTQGMKYGGVFQFLLQIKMLLHKKNYDYVYVFFDDEDSGILRYSFYNDYKSNRDKNYAKNSEDVSDYMKEYNRTLKEMQRAIFNKKNGKKNDDDKTKLEDEFIIHRSLLMKYFNELYIRWVFDEKTEGDDLIAYYVKHKKPNDKVVIVSADEDLGQLISDTVCIYNPRLKQYVSNKNFKEINGYIHENVVIKKIFCGDTSDNIGNIDGLSEKRLFELIPEIKERPITINEVKERAKEKINERKVLNKKPLKWHENIINGISKRRYDGDFYEINDKLINLSKPILSKEAKDEMDNTMYAPMDPEGRSFTNLYQYMIDDDITELINNNNFSSFFSTFKSLADKEKFRFEEFIKKSK